MILHQISLRDALARAEALRRFVEEQFVAAHSEARMTISCGATMVLSCDTHWRQALSRAQNALSRGRETLRNVVCHEVVH